MQKFEETIKSYAAATEAGRAEEAQLAAFQALMMSAEEALKNPTPDLILKQKADDLESSCEWIEAEQTRREILVMEEQTGNFHLIAKAQMDLSRLLQTIGRMDEASNFAHEAVVSARRTSVFPLLVMALHSEAACALARGNHSEALAAACEAVEVIEPGKVYDNIRARAFTTRARCRLANGDGAGATADLNAGQEPPATKTAFPGMPGPLFTMANWWETKSELEDHQGNPGAARDALNHSMEYRKHLDSPHARFGLARSFDRLAGICHKAGDFEAEKSALHEAKSIRRQLKLPVGATSGPKTTIKEP
jgi:tetratricopeptide (TPR) repeat protein